MSRLPSTPAMMEAATALINRWDEIDALLDSIEKLECEVRVLRNSFSVLAQPFPGGSLPTREECLELLGQAE